MSMLGDAILGHADGVKAIADRARAGDGQVGPEGGRILVNRTVELIHELWD
jgi:hypothetical protein